MKTRTSIFVKIGLAFAIVTLCIFAFLCSCAPKEIDTTNKASIEEAVGAAESIPIEFNKKYAAAAPTEKGASENMTITVAGLKGGTGETYVDEGNLSASEFLIAYLNELKDKTIHFRIAAIKCGEKSNVIPNSFTLTLNINKKHEEEAKQAFESLTQKLKSEHPNDAAFTTQIDIEAATGTFPSRQDTEKIQDILNALPNGVVKMNKTYKNVIETFGNIAYIELIEGRLNVSAFLRSTDKNELKNQANEISDKLKSFKIDWAAPDNIG